MLHIYDNIFAFSCKKKNANLKIILVSSNIHSHVLVNLSNLLQKATLFAKVSIYGSDQIKKIPVFRVSRPYLIYWLPETYLFFIWPHMYTMG